MDTSDPSITFDSDGRSNHYWDFHQNVKQHMHSGDNGQLLLQKLVSNIKASKSSSGHDCLIGLSGGVDSSFLLHTLVKDYGLNPLVFHVDGGWNSELAVNNINNLVDKLGLDLFTEVINWNEMADFQLAMFKSGVPHLDTPQDLAFIGILYKFASKYNIRYILNGGNISTECVSRPLQYIYYGTDMRHINHILSRFGTVPMRTYPFSSVFYHKIYLRYLKRVKVVKPLNYLDYNKANAIKLLTSEYGWKPYPQKHYESRFTRFFEGFWLPNRFGFDMRRVEYSSLILTNQLTRFDALKLLEDSPYDSNDMRNDFAFVADKLNITVEELSSYMDMPLKYYWNYKNNYKLISFGESVLKRITPSRRGGAF